MGRPSGALGQQGRGRERVLAAALALFAEHGVAGTSLQMIADRVGVTKAAVYHQFRAKEDISLALAEPVMRDLRDAVDVALQESTPQARRRAAVRGMIDVIIAHRQLSAALYRDPVMERLIADNEDWVAAFTDLRLLLTGPDPDVGCLVAVTVFGVGLSYVPVNPATAGLADDELRVALLAVADRLLD